MNSELLYNQLYERTKNFGRTHFIKELMRLERENNQLKEQLKTKYEGFKAIIDQNCEYATILIELRSWLEEQIKHGWKEDEDAYRDVLNKLNELEGKNEN